MNDNQLDLLDFLEGDRDGTTYDTEFDLDRLNKQAKRVYKVMRDGDWWALHEIAEHTGDPEASVSARLRDLRKPKFGGFTINRRRRNDAGLFEYQLQNPDQYQPAT